MSYFSSSVTISIEPESETVAFFSNNKSVGFVFPRLRSSFREGPRSPPRRRTTRERRLDSVEEEDVDLAMEERKYEETMATLRSKK